MTFCFPLSVPSAGAACRLGRPEVVVRNTAVSAPADAPSAPEDACCCSIVCSSGSVVEFPGGAFGLGSLEGVSCREGLTMIAFGFWLVG